jgi:hypothetical protein
MNSFHHFSKQNVNTLSQISLNSTNSNSNIHPISCSSNNMLRSTGKFLTIPKQVKNNNSSPNQSILKNQNEEIPIVLSSRGPGSPIRSPERSSREKNLITQLHENFPPKVRKKCNFARTNLLLLVNKELTDYKKNSKTKINSQSLKDAEMNYSSQNNQYFLIEEDIYSPRCHMGEVAQHKHGETILSCESYSPIEKSPLSYKFSILDKSIHLNSSRGDDSICNTPKREKTSIAGKKLNYFRVSTILKIGENNFEKKENSQNPKGYKNSQFFKQSTKNLQPRPSITSTLLNNNLTKVDLNLEYINVDYGILKKNTLKRTEKGFKYLRSLAKKYKKPSNKRKSIADCNFEVLKEILCIKENIEIDNLNKEKIEKDRERENNMQISNKSMKNSSSKSIISIVEKKSPKLDIIPLNNIIKQIPSNFQSSSSKSKLSPTIVISQPTDSSNNMSKRRNTQNHLPSIFIIPNEKDERSSQSNSSSLDHTNTPTDSNSDTVSSRSDSCSSVSSMRLSVNENLENDEDSNCEKLYGFPISRLTRKSSTTSKYMNRENSSENEGKLIRKKDVQIKSSLFSNKASSQSSNRRLNNSFHHISKKDSEDFFIKLYQC